MHFGVKLPTLSPLQGQAPILSVATRAEELGFDAVWVTDHVVFPQQFEARYPYSATGEFRFDPTFNSFDPLITLAVVAGHTRRIALGSAVLVLPVRNPVVVAKMVATLDALAGSGRVILGVGAGWLKEEFEALAAQGFEHRGAVTDEWIQILRGCWAEGVTSFAGNYYRFAPLYCNPKPASPIPIWIGGNSEAALRRAGRTGDGWTGTRLTAEDLGPAIASIRRHARDCGRDADALVLAVGLEADIRGRADEAESRDLVGTPEQLVSHIKELEALGLHQIELRFRPFRGTPPSLDAALRQMEVFAAEVMPFCR